MKRKIGQVFQLLAVLFLTLPLNAEEEMINEEIFCEEIFNKSCDKVSVYGAYIHLELLDHDNPTTYVDAACGRIEGCWRFWDGFTIEPMFMGGGNFDDEYITTSLGIGYVVPLLDCFSITPSVGGIYTYIKTKTVFEPAGLRDLNETFNIWSPYIRLAASWTFFPSLRLYGHYQYAWSENYISITHLPKMTEWWSGSNVELVLQYDFYECWSIDLGGEYTYSLKDSKRGIQSYGAKLGLVRWF